MNNLLVAYKISDEPCKFAEVGVFRNTYDNGTRETLLYCDIYNEGMIKYKIKLNNGNLEVIVLENKNNIDNHVFYRKKDDYTWELYSLGKICKYIEEPIHMYCPMLSFIHPTKETIIDVNELSKPIYDYIKSTITKQKEKTFYKIPVSYVNNNLYFKILTHDYTGHIIEIKKDRDSYCLWLPNNTLYLNLYKDNEFLYLYWEASPREISVCDFLGNAIHLEEVIIDEESMTLCSVFNRNGQVIPSTQYIPQGTYYYDSYNKKYLIYANSKWNEIDFITYRTPRSNNTRPDLSDVPVGFVFKDRNISRLIFKFDEEWIDANGNSPERKVGTTSQRPILTGNTNIGYCYYDIIINKPIWWTGSKWVDATGIDV